MSKSNSFLARVHIRPYHPFILGFSLVHCPKLDLLRHTTICISKFRHNWFNNSTITSHILFFDADYINDGTLTLLLVTISTFRKKFVTRLFIVEKMMGSTWYSRSSKRGPTSLISIDFTPADFSYIWCLKYHQPMPILGFYLWGALQNSLCFNERCNNNTWMKCNLID